MEDAAALINQNNSKLGKTPSKTPTIIIEQNNLKSESLNFYFYSSWNFTQNVYSIERVICLVLIKNRELQYHRDWATVACVISTVVKTEAQFYLFMKHFLLNAFPKVFIFFFALILNSLPFEFLGLLSLQPRLR